MKKESVMLDVEIFDSDGKRRVLQVPDESMIGTGAQNEIRLDSWRVGREHARLFSTPGGVLVEDLGGFGGVLVNGERIEGQYGPLRHADTIAIGPCRLRLLNAAARIADVSPPASLWTVAQMQAPMQGPVQMPAQMQTPTPIPAQTQTQRGVQAEADAFPATSTDAASASMTSTVDDAARQREFEWRKTIHTRLLETMDLRRQDVHGMSDSSCGMKPRHWSGRSCATPMPKFLSNSTARC